MDTRTLTHFPSTDVHLCSILYRTDGSSAERLVKIRCFVTLPLLPLQQLTMRSKHKHFLCQQHIAGNIIRFPFPGSLLLSVCFAYPTNVRFQTSCFDTKPDVHIPFYLIARDWAKQLTELPRGTKEMHTQSHRFESLQFHGPEKSIAS